MTQKNQDRHRIAAAVLLAAAGLAASVPALAIEPATVGFDDGREGWRAPRGSGGFSWIDRQIGAGAPALHTRFEDFGITFSNRRNDAFVGDYSALPALEIGLDVLTNSITFFGAEVTRELVLELRDHDNVSDGYPYVSVWVSLGTLDASVAGWQSLSVTIADTSAGALPTGWGGYGAEDPVTYEPMLPEGRSFADVLAGVDEIAFTTLVPGHVYGATRFDVAIDNVFIRPAAPVPEPASALLLLAGLAGVTSVTGVTALRRRA